MLSSADFFQNELFRKIISKISLDPDQDGHSVGPDLGPNCFKVYQRTHASVNQVSQLFHFITFFETFNLNK